VPVGHVEAGLRTAGIDSPFPEELNRRMISEAARWHFAPTAWAAGNLRRESHHDEVHVVGNTVVDAALWTAARADRQALERLVPGVGRRPFVLVTAHRRESFGRPMAEMAAAVEALAVRHSGVEFIVPLHPNPRAAAPFAERLADIANVRLTAPLPYPAMISLVADALLILTDSGGLQEEAPSFGVPVLVMREETERPEGLEAGCSRLVGTCARRISAAFEEALAAGPRLAPANPYGDGRSAPRIAGILVDSLNQQAVEAGRSARTAAHAR
jgi:UDP-N-acetylglucosamine 2-epimerase (non-hydrolysing)